MLCAKSNHGPFNLLRANNSCPTYPWAITQNDVAISAAASAIHWATAVARLNPHARGARTNTRRNTCAAGASTHTGRNAYPGSACTNAGRDAYPGGADTGGRNCAWACDTAFRYAHGLAINNRARRRRGKCEAQRHECN